MIRRGLAIAVLACAAVLATAVLAAPGPVLPASVTSSLLGPKLIRAEVNVNGKDHARHDYQLVRGKLLKRYAAGTLNVLERDGTKAPINVVAGARVLLNKKPSTLRGLRAGMQIAVAYDGDSPADTVYATGPRQTPKWPPATAALLFGNKLIRAEFYVLDTAQHDYLLDHGRIRQVSAYTLTIHEADSTDVSVNVSPTARVRLNGQNGTFLQLRKGMMVTTMHDGDSQPADQVFATGK